MNTLHIYPTSRALRLVGAQQRKEDGFLPSLMRMDEFEQRSIVIENKNYIDPLLRVLYLKEAAKFEAFQNLKLDLSLVRFFTKSDALFKFFEELSSENVSFETLANADAYAEFGKHLEVLETLLERYQNLLENAGFIDKAFVPQNYSLNEGFIKGYSEIDVHIEGYLSYFELMLLEKISKFTSLNVHYTTSKFNIKMQDRFRSLGLDMKNNKHLYFSLSDKKILSSTDNDGEIEAEVYVVEERDEQVAVAFSEIEEMVKSGMPPENIVLVLPDENFKEHFMVFDHHNNLNFAMGYDYSNGRSYKMLEALYVHWQSHDASSKKLLERYGFKLETLEKMSISKKVKADDFFLTLKELNLQKIPLCGEKSEENFNENIYEKYLHFSKILENELLTLKEWLFLWLKSLSKVTLDDVRGGKITVMGVLETRGVSFEGVVIVDFNEGIVPATSSKDQFLNSSVRDFANLPTKSDRDALQKQYYKRLLEQAKQASILYSISDNKLPSKFLYELGLKNATHKSAQLDLLYSQQVQCQKVEDPKVDPFNASDIVWSASRMKCYLDCKRKYYYKYVQKIEEKKEEELNEGSFLHKLLDHLHKENSYYGTTEEMHKKIDLLLEDKELLPYQDAKTAYQKLLWKEKLKGYVDSQVDHFKSNWRVVEREKEFQGEIGGLQFKGRIDRIDQNETHTLVIDYKSGSIKEANKSKNFDSLTDFQMSIYHGMLSSRYQNITLAFLKIFENGEMDEIVALEEKSLLLEEHIRELKQTKSFVAQKCEDLKKCQYCPYILMCERGEYL